MHMTIPESLTESEHAIQVVYSQSTVTAHDSNICRKKCQRSSSIGTVTVLKSVNYVAASIDQESYLAITQDLLNIHFNDPVLIPRSSYRKAIGEGFVP